MSLPSSPRVVLSRTYWLSWASFSSIVLSQENFLRDAQNYSSPALPEPADAVKIILQHSTVNHSRLYICFITTMPEQLMNKLCVKTPFPNGTVAMETLESTNNINLARTVKLEVRSIDQLENVHRTAFEHGRHSQREKVCYRPTILKGLPAIPAQSRWKYTIGKIIFQLDQGRWNTVEMKSSAPVMSNDIPAGYYFHTNENPTIRI